MNINSEEYPFCQLNETVNLSPDNKVLSKSLMINLRNQSPEIVYKNYLKLKQLIENPDEKPEKKVTKNNPGKAEKQNKKESKKDNPGTCPKCGSPLIHRSGISRNGRSYNFLGCSSFPICSYTRNIPDKEAIPVADQDMIDVAEIPF